MKAAFCTLATGKYRKLGGTDNLVKSAAKFHPDVPFLVFSDNEMETILSNYQDTMTHIVKSLPKKYRPSPPFQEPDMGYYHSFIGQVLSQHFDLVIYIDCDSLVLGELTEVFEGDYELACVRNMADNGKAGCFDVVIEDIDPLKYVNGGFTAARRKDFWESWALLNLGAKYNAPLAEQYTLNLLLHSGEYKGIILDPPESKVYYGIASTYGTETHWDSWERIEIQDDKVMLDGKQIKILHEAGGTHLPKMNLDDGFLPKQICNWIKGNILGD